MSAVEYVGTCLAEKFVKLANLLMPNVFSPRRVYVGDRPAEKFVKLANLFL